jgi:protein SCO1/2|tara:strand:- start:7 stop:696 length:690 start_codon:yes stop_codon:yes gene_type:complete
MLIKNFFKKYSKFLSIIGVISIITLIMFYKILTPKEFLPIYQPAEVNFKLVDSSLQHIKKFHKISNFNLVNQNGNNISQEFYHNKIYVADFFFTTCPSICPIMTNNMLKVQEKIKNDPNVLIVSFSVDPKTDSVAQLKKYAKEKGVDDLKWNLLTGDKKQIYDLARKSFFVAEIDKDSDSNDIIHTENFVLVDPDKRIRGFYDGTNLDEIKNLISDLSLLKGEYQDLYN